MSEDRSFGLSTALFHVTMYRQYARKVGTSTNSALIRYYLPRLKLSIALLSRKRGDERLVKIKVKGATHGIISERYCHKVAMCGLTCRSHICWGLENHCNITADQVIPSHKQSLHHLVHWKLNSDLFHWTGN